MTSSASASRLDQLCIDTIRTLAIDAVQKANSGHPGAPMGLAPVAYTLYTRVLRHDPSAPRWPDRDRFVLSAGHASMLLYATLHLAGYNITLEDIEHFRQVGWPTPGHPERDVDRGVETTTGPLGQGISTAVGLALGERLLAARFNRDGHDLVDHRTFVIASDGDLQEGISAEACSLAGHLGLGRLIVFFDNNHVQLASPTSAVISEDVAMRFEAYGWHVQDVGEDLSPERLEQAAREAIEVADRPSLVMVRSHIGFGSPHKQDSCAAHGSPLGEEEVRLVKEAYGWDPDRHFYVPAEALEHFRAACAHRAREHADWRARFDAYRTRFPEQARLFEQIAAGELSDGWDVDPPRFDPAQTKPMATRKASGEAIQWAAGRIPQLVGGSADLASSNNTDIAEGGEVQRDAYGGRNIRFGVREHAMGAIVNGLCLDGLRAFGGTFLTFNDYMRGAVRLSALMALPSIWVYTHDSIGLGEDGPTHQPIEQLASLRAMPRLKLIRPADANETVLAWRYALHCTDAPTALSLSRQELPIIDPDAIPDDAIERGAYVLEDHGAGGEPDLILIATGSEVSLCQRAARMLEELRVRVVSMPCMENFAAAEEEYRELVLPATCTRRIAVEAACPLGWDRWIGPHGRFVGMESFGESGPAEAVYEHFGITAERVCELARELARA